MLGLDLWSQPICCLPQAWAPHAMQFPAELTKGSCVASRPAELRLVCIYFFTAHLFQVSSEQLAEEASLSGGWQEVRSSSLELVTASLGPTHPTCFRERQKTT